MPTQYTRLMQFSHQFRKFYIRRFKPLLERTGLSMREVDVLLFLANNPAHDAARDITEYRGLSKAQVSQAVELLAAEGLIDRASDDNDRRVIHLSITPEGQPLARECQDIQAACLRRLLDGLSAAEQAQLQILLDTVLENGMRLAEEVPL